MKPVTFVFSSSYIAIQHNGLRLLWNFYQNLQRGIFLKVKILVAQWLDRLIGVQVVAGLIETEKFSKFTKSFSVAKENYCFIIVTLSTGHHFRHPLRV